MITAQFTIQSDLLVVAGDEEYGERDVEYLSSWQRTTS
jgi:hypothetical protein